MEDVAGGGGGGGSRGAPRSAGQHVGGCEGPEEGGDGGGGGDEEKQRRAEATRMRGPWRPPLHICVPGRSGDVPVCVGGLRFGVGESSVQSEGTGGRSPRSYLFGRLPILARARHPAKFRPTGRWIRFTHRPPCMQIARPAARRRLAGPSVDLEAHAPRIANHKLKRRRASSSSREVCVVVRRPVPTHATTDHTVPHRPPWTWQMTPPTQPRPPRTGPTTAAAATPAGTSTTRRTTRPASAPGKRTPTTPRTRGRPFQTPPCRCTTHTTTRPVSSGRGPPRGGPAAPGGGPTTTARAPRTGWGSRPRTYVRVESLDWNRVAEPSRA